MGRITEVQRIKNNMISMDFYNMAADMADAIYEFNKTLEEIKQHIDNLEESRSELIRLQKSSFKIASQYKFVTT